MEPRPRFLPKPKDDGYQGPNFDPTSQHALIATLLALGDVLLGREPEEAVKTARAIVIHHLNLLGHDYALNSWMEWP